MPFATRVESHVGEGAREALVPRSRDGDIPLSLAQQRMWFLNRYDTESAVNNIPIAIRLSGELDVAALQVAVIDVIDRHESLRTVYPLADNPFVTQHPIALSPYHPIYATMHQEGEDKDRSWSGNVSLARVPNHRRTPNRRARLRTGSSVAGHRQPIRRCRAVSTRYAVAGTWRSTTWSERRRRDSRKIPGGNG